MKVVSNIIKFILEIVLTIIIIFLLLSLIVSSTFLNKKYVKDKLEETGYYTEIYNEVQSNFENYLGQSGLEENVFKNIISEEKVREDTNLIIDNIYDGLIEKVNTDEIKTNLSDKISEVYKSNNTKTNKKDNTSMTEKQKQAINEYIDKISEEYVETVLHTEYEKNINKIIINFKNYVNLIKKVSICSVAVIVIILLAMNFKNIFKGLTQIGVPILSTGIFFIIVNYIINLKINVKNIVVLNKAFSDFLIDVIEDILNIITKYGLIMLGIGILIIVLGNIVSTIKKTKSKED